MGRNPQPLVTDFQRGLDTVVSPLSQQATLRTMNNVWLSPTDRGAIEVIPGYVKVNSVEIAGDPTFHTARLAVDGSGNHYVLISYIDTSNNEHIVRMQPDGTVTEIAAHDTSPAITVPDFDVVALHNPQNSKEYFFFSNGTDAGFKYDPTGSALSASGVTQPSVTNASVATNAGGNNSVKGVVSYYIAQITGTTEGAHSAEIGPIDAGTGTRIDVDLSHADFSGKTYRVYRTQQDGGTPYFVSQVTGGSTYTDDTPDRDLGDLPYMHGDVPPTGLVSLVVHDNRIWGITTDSLLYFSDLESPESWWDAADGNREPINREDGDQSVALARDSAGIIVFKENHVYRVVVVDSLPSDVHEITLGTQENRSLGLASVNALSPIRQGLAWYWNRGVYLMVGGQVTYISEAIEDDLATIRNQDESDGVYVGFYPKRNHLYVSVPLSDGVTPTHTYIFDLEMGQWIGRMTTGFRGFIATEGAGGDEEFWGLSADSTEGFVYKLDNGNNWAGTAINASCELPPLVGSGITLFHSTAVEFEPKASGTFNVVHILDGKSSASLTTSIEQTEANTDHHIRRVNVGWRGRSLVRKIESNADQPRWKVYRLTTYMAAYAGRITEGAAVGDEKAFKLIARDSTVTTAQRDAITSPTAGWIVYNSDNNRYEFYNGSAWAAFATSSLADIPYRSTYPAPSANAFELWMSDGTPAGTGNGDILLTINSGGTTKHLTVSDWSVLP